VAACSATTKAGKPCQAPALPGRPFCFHHDPERAVERADAKRRGGLSLHYGQGGPSRSEVRVRTVADVCELLEVAAGDAPARKPCASRARLLAYVASIALRAAEAHDLEERVRALEARLKLRRIP
jgi:hypothetical protein